MTLPSGKRRRVVIVRRIPKSKRDDVSKGDGRRHECGEDEKEKGGDEKGDQHKFTGNVNDGQHGPTVSPQSPTHTWSDDQSTVSRTASTSSLSPTLTEATPSVSEIAGWMADKRSDVEMVPKEREWACDGNHGEWDYKNWCYDWSKWEQWDFNKDWYDNWNWSAQHDQNQTRQSMGLSRGRSSDEVDAVRTLLRSTTGELQPRSMESDFDLCAEDQAKKTSAYTNNSDGSEQTKQDEKKDEKNNEQKDGKKDEEKDKKKMKRMIRKRMKRRMRRRLIVMRRRRRRKRKVRRQQKRTRRRKRVMRKGIQRRSKRHWS